MQILCSLHSFSRWLRYWCAEIMNYETVATTLRRHPVRHSLYMHIDEMPSIFFFIYARPIPRIIHDTPRFTHRYIIWSSTPATVYLRYTYIIFVAAAAVVARSHPPPFRHPATGDSAAERKFISGLVSSSSSTTTTTTKTTSNYTMIILYAYDTCVVDRRLLSMLMSTYRS